MKHAISSFYTIQKLFRFIREAIILNFLWPHNIWGLVLFL